jgi:hypothetical protein
MTPQDPWTGSPARPGTACRPDSGVLTHQPGRTQNHPIRVVGIGSNKIRQAEQNGGYSRVCYSVGLLREMAH